MSIEDAAAVPDAVAPFATLVSASRKAGDDLLERGDEQGAQDKFAAALTLHRSRVREPLLRAFETASASPAWTPRRAEVVGKLAAAAADAWGIEGGLARRLGRSVEAADSYGKGAELEIAHGMTSTYNRINTLLLEVFTNRIAADALALRAGPLAEGLRKSLHKSDLKGRAWALADFGLVLLFSGHSAGEAIASAYAPLADVRDFPAKSMVRTIADLRECDTALRAGEPEIASRFRAVADFLAERAAERP